MTKFYNSTRPDMFTGYTGPMGHTCFIEEALEAARLDRLMVTSKDKFYNTIDSDVILAYIGPSGERCDTIEALQAANANYARRFLQPKVFEMDHTFINTDDMILKLKKLN